MLELQKSAFARLLRGGLLVFVLAGNGVSPVRVGQMILKINHNDSVVNINDSVYKN